MTEFRVADGVPSSRAAAMGDFATLTITAAESKSGKSRSIPMAWGGVVDALKGVQSRSSGSTCAQLGMDVMTIKELMGHASVTTTMRYMHVGEDHKRRALREAGAKWQENSE